MQASLAVEHPKVEEMMTKDEKKLFIVFTKVLLRYLEKKDPVVYLLAKQTIREAIDPNSRKDTGQKCPLNSMKKRLESLVPKQHWKRAEEFLLQKLKENNAKNQDNNSIDILAGIFSPIDALNHIYSCS